MVRQRASHQKRALTLQCVGSVQQAGRSPPHPPLPASLIHRLQAVVHARLGESNGEHFVELYQCPSRYADGLLRDPLDGDEALQVSDAGHLCNHVTYFVCSKNELIPHTMHHCCSYSAARLRSVNGYCGILTDILFALGQPCMTSAIATRHNRLRDSGALIAGLHASATEAVKYSTYPRSHASTRLLKWT